VGGAQLGLRDVRARDVREDVGGVERRDEDDDGDERAERDQDSPEIATATAVGPLPRSPQRHDADAEEHDAGGEGEQPCEVVARGAALRRVVDGLDSGHDAEEPDEHRDDCPGAGSQARIAPCSEREHGDRHEAAHEVVARRGPRLGLKEAVVDDVERDDPDRGACDDRLRQPVHSLIMRLPVEAPRLPHATCRQLAGHCA
jgi:hypothetical protein